MDSSGGLDRVSTASNFSSRGPRCGVTRAARRRLAAHCKSPPAGFIAPGNLPQPTDVTLTVRQHGSLIPDGTLLTAAAIGKPLPGALSGGFFAADSFTRGGFDSLSLGGSVSFEGPVSLTARGFLRVATEGILTGR